MKPQTIIITTFFVLCLLLLAGFSHAGVWVENFDDGDYKDWKLFIGTEPNRAEVKVVNGELVFKQPGVFSSYSDYLMLEASRDWSDYTIELRFKFAEEIGPNINLQRMGVTYHDGFQSVQEGGPNFAIVLARLNGSVHGDVMINGVGRLIKDGWYKFSQGSWYRMKILVEGTHYELFIDDQQVVAYDWNGFTKGGIGIYAEEVVTYFDDIRIYGDSVPNGGTAAVRAHGKLTTTWAALKK